jgi:hypothetical protein
MALRIKLGFTIEQLESAESIESELWWPGGFDTVAAAVLLVV